MRDAPDEREAGEADPASLGSLFSRLVADGRALLRAELDLYRSLALQRLTGSRRVAILAIAGLLVIAGSVTALLVGLVLALARLIGALWAAAAVGGGGILVGLALLWLAIHYFQRIGADPEEDAR
ncbi:MAG TPA: phage holin family protein [Sphingomonadaceae bacterium]|nr:phage holin family protein [Sphingomonadaceae bacterium]